MVFGPRCFCFATATIKFRPIKESKLGIALAIYSKVPKDQAVMITFSNGEIIIGKMEGQPDDGIIILTELQGKCVYINESHIRSIQRHE